MRKYFTVRQNALSAQIARASRKMRSPAFGIPRRPQFPSQPLSSTISNPELLTVIDLLKRYLSIMW
jgi:hypothetical protein